jgi:PIN domain nuclease of toxin-antitoxin system
VICVVDTHALVWYFLDSDRLSRTARALLKDGLNRIIIPTIVLAELKYLHHRGRVSVSYDALMEVIEADPRCELYPFDHDILSRLPVELEIHDGIICATALSLAAVSGDDVKVVTRDAEVTASGLVATIW